jgi:hypothetical protein
MSSDKTAAATTAAEMLRNIAWWARATFIATAIGSTVLVIGVGYGLSEYVCLKSAMASASAEMAKSAGEFNAKFKVRR